MTTWNKSAINRLLRDLKEVLENPLPNVVAVPDEADIFTWHGNVRGDAGSQFTDVPFHFTLSFPDDYPKNPPQIGLFTRLPHPNIVQQPGRRPGLRLALWDCNPKDNGWSCAYSVHSIMVQLQAFLVCEDLLWGSVQATLADAIHHASRLEVEGCSHTGLSPWPPFPTAEEIAMAAKRAKTNKTSMAAPTARRRRPMAATTGSRAASVYKKSDAEVSGSAQGADDGWKVAEGKKCKKLPRAASNAKPAAKPAGWEPGSNPYGNLKLAADLLADQVKPTVVVKVNATTDAESSATSPEAPLPSAAASSSGSAATKLSKTAQKNARRSKKRAMRSLTDAVEAVKDAATVEDSSAVPSPQGGALWRSSDVGRDAGGFTALPPDMLATILSLLERKDIARLCSTCRGLRAACEEGEVWRRLLERDYAGALITASTAADWKHAYMLQAHNIVGELQCYFSKVGFTEEVLGFPLHFTTNPRTGVVDYITLHPQLLSLEAFQQGVRQTPGREDLPGDVTALLPAYLTEEHFERAQPQLLKTLRVLTPEVPPRQLTPAHWLDACAKMLNTAVVLLIDNGIAASQKAFCTYCSIHRLMLALAERFDLWGEAERRLDCFLAKPSARTKAECPNLGWLLAMLVLSRKHKWSQVAPALLSEMLDRSVLWACRADASLVPLFARPELAGGADKQLLKGVFDSMRVSRGLLAFHSAFMHYVARPPRVALEQVMEQADVLYGWPSSTQVSRLQKAVARIQAVRDWPAFLHIAGVIPCSCDLPLDCFMTRELRRAWQNSLRKSYHTKGMDFTRVQASGVSKILLKGQTYSAPPNMKRMELVNVWKWEDATAFLDASVLLYGKDGHPICNVDYSSTASFGTKVTGAVRHSGDIMEGNVGKHIVHVRLDQLGDHVQLLYVVISAFAEARLIDCKQPHTIIRDCVTRMNLCEYHLADNAANQLRTNKCVVMCRIFRGRLGWEVEALGDMLERGSVDDYQPLYDHVQGCMRATE